MERVYTHSQFRNVQPSYAHGITGSQLSRENLEIPTYVDPLTTEPTKVSNQCVITESKFRACGCTAPIKEAHDFNCLRKVANMELNRNKQFLSFHLLHFLSKIKLCSNTVNLCQEICEW